VFPHIYFLATTQWGSLCADLADEALNPFLPEMPPPVELFPYDAPEWGKDMGKASSCRGLSGGTGAWSMVTALLG
jgi:hypothetical protein